MGVTNAARGWRDLRDRRGTVISRQGMIVTAGSAKRREILVGVIHRHSG
jgi:hypothetical protein